MLGTNEFELWIKASHVMFEIFEGRYDAYPLAKKWVQEWFSSGSFTVTEEHINRILALVDDFDYEVYGVTGELKEKIDKLFRDLLSNNLQKGQNQNIGFAISPYLFTWNFRRFKEYFKRKQHFNVDYYFKSLGEFLNAEKQKLEPFRSRNLISDRMEKREVESVFSLVNNKLQEIGIKNNEPVGTIKLLHIFAPTYFPLLDNDIAKALGLVASYRYTGRWARQSLTSDLYFKWMTALKVWLQNFKEKIGNLESEHNSSILKLVDEGLYMMSTVKQKTRVRDLGIEV